MVKPQISSASFFEKKKKTRENHELIFLQSV